MTEQDKMQASPREAKPETAPRFAHKKIFGFDYDDNDTIKLLIYLVIGGTAALF